MWDMALVDMFDQRWLKPAARGIDLGRNAAAAKQSRAARHGFRDCFARPWIAADKSNGIAYLDGNKPRGKTVQPRLARN